MAEQTLTGRLILDRRTHQEWMQTDPIAKFGELMIVEVPVNTEQVEQEPCFLLKVGDGEKPYSQLNWFSGLAADVYDWAKDPSKPTYTATEINGLSTYIQEHITDGSLSFNLTTFPTVSGTPTADNQLVNKGYVDDQIENISLTPGPQGPQGETGPQGPTGETGPKGDTGGYYTPSVNAEGVLSWTASETDMTAVPTANIKGPQGIQGNPGADGGYYTPSVDASGNLTWTGSKAGMAQVTGTNIKGPQGDQGIQGPEGPQGPAGTSAYQAAQTGGFTGTETEFNTALGKIGSATAVSTLAFGPRSVATSAWAADSTQPDYGFRAAIALDGVTENHSPDVRLSLSDAVSGILSPVAASYNGGVYIYASEQPAAAVNVESIICTLVTE